jgi:hypothetical protein
MIDNYEGGKFPNADPRFSGPFVVDDVECRRLTGLQSGQTLFHYPENLYRVLPVAPFNVSEEDSTMREMSLRWYPAPADLFVSSDYEAVERSILKWEAIRAGVPVKKIHIWLSKVSGEVTEYYGVSLGDLCSLCRRAEAMENMIEAVTGSSVCMCDLCPWYRLLGVTCDDDDSVDFSKSETVLKRLYRIISIMNKMGVKNIDDWERINGDS